MSKFSLNSDMMIEVKIRFIAKGSDAPLTGDDYKVSLFDKDLVGSDKLGASGLANSAQADKHQSHLIW